MPSKLALLAAATAAAGTITGVAVAGSGHHAIAAGHRAAAQASRLDDGAALLPQATITEQQAIAAAQRAASGALDEVDLEQHDGRLVFNVDVGGSDVKVDAATGQVVASTRDD